MAAISKTLTKLSRTAGMPQVKYTFQEKLPRLEVARKALRSKPLIRLTPSSILLKDLRAGSVSIKRESLVTGLKKPLIIWKSTIIATLKPSQMWRNASPWLSMLLKYSMKRSQKVQSQKLKVQLKLRGRKLTMSAKRKWLKPYHTIRRRI
jgi:hypothetical protein